MTMHHLNPLRPITLRRLLLAATILAGPVLALSPGPVAAQVSIDISVPLAPPELPVYVQPPMPDDGYIWTPGYWSWSQPVGYFWVPGTWVLPPVADVLWTPPYWGWSGGSYRFHDGYWGPTVGYYGGVNYGYGYGGQGYQGGRWQGANFVYNRTVNNFGSVHVPNVYASGVSAANRSHVSYAGGTGGLRTAPNAGEQQAARQHHVPMTAEQTSHVSAAARLPDLAASHNSGHPAIAATSRPAQFEGAGVVHASPGAAPGAKPANAPEQPTAVLHPGLPANHQGAEHEALTPPRQDAARPDEHGTQPLHAAAPPAERMAPPTAAPQAEHGALPPQHTTARPDEHVAQPAAHAAAPPAEHVAPPAAAPRPAERAAVPAPPAQREAPRPAERTQAAPAERAPPPAQHAAAQPAPAHGAPGEKEKER